MKTLKFRSLLTSKSEVEYGGNTSSATNVTTTEYLLDGAREHEIEYSFSHTFLQSLKSILGEIAGFTFIIGPLFSLMITPFYRAFSGSPDPFLSSYLIVCKYIVPALFFLSLLLVIAEMETRAMRDYVDKTRGRCTGNSSWKIVPESKWGSFIASLENKEKNKMVNESI